MSTRHWFACFLLICASLAHGQQRAVALPMPAPVPAPRVVLHTSMGEIVIELAPDKAPATVDNFLRYVREGFYNGTILHRVIDNLLIQGGAYTADMQTKPTHSPISLESNNGLSNLRGTIAAARAPSAAGSATAQFFINVVDNPRFDFSSESSDFTRGFAVFGTVVAGMDVVDRIRLVPTQAQDPLPRDVPVTPIVIERIEVLAASGQ